MSSILPGQPTPYDEVNTLLLDLLARVQVILGKKAEIPLLSNFSPVNFLIPRNVS
jgi:hypothetical protein